MQKRLLSLLQYYYFVIGGVCVCECVYILILFFGFQTQRPANKLELKRNQYEYIALLAAMYQMQEAYIC